MISCIEKALVVDDDILMREFVVETLSRNNVAVTEAGNGTQARQLLSEKDFDIAFLDIKMPGMSGMDLLRWKKKESIPTLTVMVTAFGTVEQAVEAMKLGAMDFLMKPFSPEQVQLVLKKAGDWMHLNAHNEYLKEELGWSLPRDQRMIGETAVMKRIQTQISRVAASASTVLISGESGTGKELVAQAVHMLSERARKPFVRMNCAAVPEQLVDSELFGHEKGAYTGAVSRRLGRFELADGGSLLLDEISEMRLDLQAKLLRVLQEREFERVGGSRTIKTDCRVIATTNRDLHSFVKNGHFRQDLFYRLNVLPIHIPPLRERIDDIPLLADTFLDRFRNRKNKRNKLCFTKESIALLKAYKWPGNVRELEHMVERLCVMENGPELTPAMLPRELLQAVDSSVGKPVSVAREAIAAVSSVGVMPESEVISDERQLVVENDCFCDDVEDKSCADTTEVDSCRELKLEVIERNTIFNALQTTGGHRKKAAELLGVSIRTLRNKLNLYKEQGFCVEDYAA